MAKYAGQGDTALTLAEECAEVIQIITKLKRFNGNWNEVPPGKDKTRWQMLEEEMNDVLLAWNRLQEEHHISNAEEVIWSQDSMVILYAGPSASAPSNEELEELEEKYLRSMDPTACWDGDASHSE